MNASQNECPYLAYSNTVNISGFCLNNQRISNNEPCAGKNLSLERSTVFTYTQTTKNSGSNKIEVTASVQNPDTATHSGDVQVSLLDANGDVLVVDGVSMDQTQATGNIAGGGTEQLSFTFKGKNVVSLHSSVMITIYQLS